VSKVDPARFVEGRDAYVANIPFLQIIERADQIEEEINAINDAARDAAGGGVIRGGSPYERLDPKDFVGSFVFGFLDGVLADIRLAAKNARQEIDERGSL
jgi:hypothetical protein